MKKLIGSLLLLGAMVISGNPAEAASGRSGAKTAASIVYSTTISSVAVSGPAALYQVILSSGAAGTDYTALWDKASVGATVISTTSGLVNKLVVSSATQNTVFTFDPPIQFSNGIVAGNSTALNVTTFVYQRGRVSE